MTGIIKTDQIQGAGSSTVTIPSGTALNVTTVSGTPTFSGDVTLPSINGGQIGGRRNIIINGGMQVAQRGTSLAMAHDGNTGNYLIDRFQCLFGGSPSTLDGTFAQVADHPLSANGKSLKWTTGTAESAIASDEALFFTQKVEAQNLQHLQFGNSNALTTSLSFYVKCSITGTFSISLRKDDTTKRISNRTYTINSANTWEKKTFTFTGDTDSGAGIVNDSGEGIRIMWHLMAGSDFLGGGNFTSWKDYATNDFAAGLATNAIATTASATWQLADVQWEVGSQVTPFEQRSFGEEELLCQRYYFDDSANATYILYYATNKGIANVRYRVPMRDAPTVTISASSGGITANGVTKYGFYGYHAGLPANDYFQYNADAEL